MKKIQIEAGAETIIRALEQAGYEAYAVGGCVRDSLMGREPKDWDITTSAQPEEVKAVFERTFDTGIQHGTVSVREHGRTYEVTTYRIDGSYADHRRPDHVEFTASLREDLARRDFTINAMAYHPERGLVDYFEGVKDLERGRIRCVGDPLQRFEEDALRMLRALRFSARLGFTVDPPTWQAIQEKASLLGQVSKERIHEEFHQILLSEHPESIETVQTAGLMLWCVPELAGQTVCYDALRKAPPRPVLRWAVFLQNLDVGQTDRALRELRFDNDTRRRVVRLAAFRKVRLPEEPEAMRRFLHELGREHFEDLAALQLALGASEEEQLPARRQYEKQKDSCLEIRELQIGGKELSRIGVPEGPRIGAILERLLDAVLHDPEKNREEELLRMVREWLAGEDGEK